jgi:hypothetical protein
MRPAAFEASFGAGGMLLVGPRKWPASGHGTQGPARPSAARSKTHSNPIAADCAVATRSLDFAARSLAAGQAPVIGACDVRQQETSRAGGAQLDNFGSILSIFGCILDIFGSSPLGVAVAQGTAVGLAAIVPTGHEPRSEPCRATFVRWRPTIGSGHGRARADAAGERGGRGLPDPLHLLRIPSAPTDGGMRRAGATVHHALRLSHARR